MYDDSPIHWSQLAANIGHAVAAAGILLAGLVAVVTYWRSKRREAAQWMHGIFQEFQSAPAFDEAKRIVDFQYRDVVEPLHALLVAGGNAAVPPDKWHTAHLVDRLLNYLEHLCYLADNGHARWRDCEAYFGYWLGLLSDADRGALRRYLVRFSYEHLAALVAASSDDFILLYGSLCRREPAYERLGLATALEFVGRREIAGDLYDLGEYPGVVPGPGKVSAELYRIKELEVLRRLDEFEECDLTNPARGLYRRTTVQVPDRRPSWLVQRLRTPRVVDAWIYLYNQPTAGQPLISGGDWFSYRAERDGPVPSQDPAASAGRG